MKKVIGLALAVTASVAFLASPASAEDTATTFEVQAGDLTITVPTTADLGAVEVGDTDVTAQLGVTTVSDLRGVLESDWTASVSSSSFTTGTETAPETIANSSVAYWSGAATATAGSGTFAPGQANFAARDSLGTSQDAFALSGGAGSNSASWNPNIVVTLPSAGQVAGEYSGTITHSVA